MPTFEEMVETNLRKLGEIDYKMDLNNQNEDDVKNSKEAAAKFKETGKKRKELKEKIENHIETTSTKIDEFWEWEEREMEKR